MKALGKYVYPTGIQYSTRHSDNQKRNHKQILRAKWGVRERWSTWHM